MWPGSSGSCIEFHPQGIQGISEHPGPGRVHAEAITRLFDSGVSIVNVHSGQPDQQKVLDFYVKEVLPRLKGNGGASRGGASSH